MFYKTLIIQSKLWNTQVNRSELVWLVESRPSSQQHTLFSARNPVILSNKSSKYLWITIKWKSMVISSLCVNKYILASGNRLMISLFQTLLRCNAPYAIPLPPGSLAEPVPEKNVIIGTLKQTTGHHLEQKGAQGTQSQSVLQESSWLSLTLGLSSSVQGRLFHSSGSNQGSSSK